MLQGAGGAAALAVAGVGITEFLESGATVVYASWNGATGVIGWKVDAGSPHDQWRPLGSPDATDSRR